MRVQCPECHGRRRMDYVDEPPGPPIRAVMDVAAASDMTFTVLPCRTCKGDGRVTATERVPVMQDGHRIGTVPPDFDPARIKSNNWLYNPRPGDFQQDGGVWVACDRLGRGDLEAVPGFVWERQ